MRVARSRSFRLVGCKQAMRLPSTRPSWIIVQDERMLRATFVAVPAFSRVDPVISSGPVGRSNSTSAGMRLFSRLGLHVRRMVAAPSELAASSAPRTNGVRPLAVIPQTTSFEVTPRSLMANAPPMASSSAPSMLAWIAGPPPAMIACTRSGGTPNVGGISLASSTPRRPLVPAPT